MAHVCCTEALNTCPLYVSVLMSSPGTVPTQTLDVESCQSQFSIVAWVLDLMQVDVVPCCIETYNLVHNLVYCSFDSLGSSSVLSLDISGMVNNFLGVVVVDPDSELVTSSGLPLLCGSDRLLFGVV